MEGKNPSNVDKRSVWFAKSGHVVDLVILLQGKHPKSQIWLFQCFILWLFESEFFLGQGEFELCLVSVKSEFSLESGEFDQIVS